MAADSNTSFEFIIGSNSREATKGIEKLTDATEDLGKEIEETEDEVSELVSKLGALKSIVNTLEKQARGVKLSKDAYKEKARMNETLQYYSKLEQYQKELRKNTRDKIFDASGIASSISSAGKEAVLRNKGIFLQGKMADALADGEYEKANSIRSQILANEEKIARIKSQTAKQSREENEESKKTLGTTKKTVDVAEKLKAVMSGIGGAIKSIGDKALAKIADPFNRMHKSIKTLFSSIGRIAFYRAVRSGIKAVTQGFSEGVKHLYAWSEAFNTKFAPAMDQYKTQMTYLHNGFASMFSPLIEWVIPNVLVPLTDAMVEFFNFVQQGFATLVGHDYWYKAQKSMTKFGESTKKANIQLAKFDELNNLTETGSGSDEDTSGMFTLEKVSADFGKGFFEVLRDEIKSGDWYGVGKTIADKIDEGIGSFDARGIASRIANKINDAIHFVQGFAENFGWDELGVAIGGFIDQAIKDVEWKNLGSASGNLVGGLLTMILSAIGEIDVAKAVDAFFAFWDGLFGSLGEKLFEDNGYHVKMLALKLAEFSVAVIHNALSSFRKAMKGLNLFKSPGDALFAKSLGLTEDAFNTVSETNEYMAYQAWLKPIRDAEESLKNSHEKWLAEVSKNTENSVLKLGNNVVEAFRDTGENSVRAYQSANWGTTVPTDRIKSAVISSGITSAYSSQATQALSAYTAVQWSSGGKVSADGIKNALIAAGVPASMASQASQSLATFINTLNNGKNSVINAFNNMTSGYDATGVGQRIGSQIVNGMNAVLVSSPIASVGGGNSNYRITISKNARGGYLFANGGFTSGLSQGTLYAAGEVPGQAEMVGQINGRTGVASGFEITGIRDAVISTGENEAQLLQRLISVLERKNLVISPSAQLGRVVAQSNRLYSGVTG